jgi:hypothetical protein
MGYASYTSCSGIASYTRRTSGTLNLESACNPSDTRAAI